MVSATLPFARLSVFSPQKKVSEGIESVGGNFGYLLATTLPSSPTDLTFDPATAPCAVMLPTGEQLSTSSTLNNLSSSEEGTR